MIATSHGRPTRRWPGALRNDCVLRRTGASVRRDVRCGAGAGLASNCSTRWWAVDWTIVAGIRPREISGLDGLILAPLVHYGFPHLVANAAPLILLGTFVLASGVRRFMIATFLIAIISGLGVWFLTPSNYLVVGASGVIFGWLGMLLVTGIVERSLWSLGVGLVVGLLYGWQVTALFPTDGQVSWQGHLFGFLGGSGGRDRVADPPTESRRDLRRTGCVRHGHARRRGRARAPGLTPDSPREPACASAGRRLPAARHRPYRRRSAWPTTSRMVRSADDRG